MIIATKLINNFVDENQTSENNQLKGCSCLRFLVLINVYMLRILSAVKKSKTETNMARIRACGGDNKERHVV